MIRFGVRLAFTGGREAIVRLVERHQQRLLRVCQGFLHDPEAARDAVQEVFLKAYRKAGSYRPRGKVYTWLYRIAVNHCLNRLRRRRLLRFLSFAEMGGEAAGPNGTTEIEIDRTNGISEEEVTIRLRDLPYPVLCRLLADGKELASAAIDPTIIDTNDEQGRATLTVTVPDIEAPAGEGAPQDGRPVPGHAGPRPRCQGVLVTTAGPGVPSAGVAAGGGARPPRTPRASCRRPASRRGRAGPARLLRSTKAMKVFLCKSRRSGFSMHRQSPSWWSVDGSASRRGSKRLGASAWPDRLF